MGRVVVEDDPEWLPEDRDILSVWSEFERTRHECGRWAWEYEDVEDLSVDYDVCPFCSQVGKFSERLRDQRGDMYGVHYGFYPPREGSTDGD
jgi:hypothetical protein